MPVEISHITVANILTRTSGYLCPVASHSLQPYRGCTFGGALCGVGCYVQHNWYVTRGRPWGGFLEVRSNAADVYRDTCEREAAWARRTYGRFTIFCSSATDPFVPQERRFGVTASLLAAMRQHPPDCLILQTHSHQVLDEAETIAAIAQCCDVRVHLSIETDRDSLPGLPPSASSVERRIAACARLRAVGVFTVVTVAPLLPIADPDRFFERIAHSADAVVIDHFIEGDGSINGARTAATRLPAAMAVVDPDSVTLAYRDRMVETARRHLPGRVGVSAAGFAGVYA